VIIVVGLGVGDTFGLKLGLDDDVLKLIVYDCVKDELCPKPEDAGLVDDVELKVSMGWIDGLSVGEHGGYAIYTEYLPGTKPSNL
jgi:hypothetical protein